jgi:hypothetical protein
VVFIVGLINPDNPTFGWKGQTTTGETLQIDVGKTDRHHRAAQSRVRLAAMGSGMKVSSFSILPSAFALSKARSMAASG